MYIWKYGSQRFPSSRSNNFVLPFSTFLLLLGLSSDVISVGLLDRKYHPSCLVHGAKECEGGRNDGRNPQHPAQHQSCHLTSHCVQYVKMEEEGMVQFTIQVMSIAT